MVDSELLQLANDVRITLEETMRLIQQMLELLQPTEEECHEENNRKNS